uniref:uncharacterized protein LOC122579647 isoform X2 n=1 Tax=Erigeron canadensis TaxID=72917 RepID=UPI001CB9C6CE|nr:uncharacterized protein LOC122579647 isoform X2 [Erigeron canadensis]
MDSVELQLPAAVVTTIMRSSACSTSFLPDKDDNCNVNGSRPAFWNKISEEALYRQAGQALLEHDLGSGPEAKQSQWKLGKATRSNGSSSRRSRVAHMEASMNVAGVVDANDLPKDLGSYSAKYIIAEKKQKTSVSGKRSDKRNGKVLKNKCDSFSVKAGLSSFSSAASGNNILGVYGLKHDICDFEKHVDEVSLNELLDGSYKCPESVKEKEKKPEVLIGSILPSVREACSVLQLQKHNQTPTVAAVDGTYNHSTSCIPKSAISGATTTDENKGVASEPSCDKVEASSSGPADIHANILQFPLFAPKDVLDRLALPPPKDLDLMLLDSMKPTSTSKVQNGGSLPTFPWSHVSGRDFKANPDMVKSTPSKSSCQGRWVRMGKSSTSLGDTTTATTYLADFQSLTYNQSLVPLGLQQSVPTEKDKSPLLSISNTTIDRGITSSDARTTASKGSAGHPSRELAAAQTLCNIAAEYRKQDQEGMARWQKKPFQKSIRTSKLTSDEKLEKALFAIPISKSGGPTKFSYGPDVTKKHKLSVNEKSSDLSNPTRGPFHWPTNQSSRLSSSKNFKNVLMEAKHHESSSNPLKRSIASPPARLPNKPPKLRKLLPMEWKSRVDHKGNGKY